MRNSYLPDALLLGLMMISTLTIVPGQNGIRVSRPANDTHLSQWVHGQVSAGASARGNPSACRSEARAHSMTGDSKDSSET
jgi:hypothetical protein